MECPTIHGTSMHTIKTRNAPKIEANHFCKNNKNNTFSCFLPIYTFLQQSCFSQQNQPDSSSSPLSFPCSTIPPSTYHGRRMDPEAAPTTPVSSTITSATQQQPPPPDAPAAAVALPTQLLLEVSLISAQDLAPVTKSMRTYAMAWINPSKKYTTRTDHDGHTHPTWNDKHTFKIDGPLLAADNAPAITVEIYALSWFRDVHVGTVKVLVADLLSPPNGMSLHANPKNMRFVALQVRRPSGIPQGILNMGIALTDGSKKKKKNNIPLQPYDAIPTVEKMSHDIPTGELKNKCVVPDDMNKELEEKIGMWRMRSAEVEAYNEEFPGKPGSIYNGSMVNGSVCNSSMVNGSELCSDIGPSASIVAAELAKSHQPQPKPATLWQVIKLNKQQLGEDTGSSILEELTLEEARAKGFRHGIGKDKWKNLDESDVSSYMGDEHSRRNSDGGVFSCFGTAMGIEFRITCGNPNSNKSKGKQPGHKKNKDHANSI